VHPNVDAGTASQSIGPYSAQECTRAFSNISLYCHGSRQVGRHLWVSSSPTSCAKYSQVNQAAQGFAQASSENLQFPMF